MAERAAGADQVELPPALHLLPMLGALTSAGERSSLVADREYRLKTYPQCFVGREFAERLVTCGLVQTHDDAVVRAWGRAWRGHACAVCLYVSRTKFLRAARVKCTGADCPRAAPRAGRRRAGTFWPAASLST